ncbi:Subtilisin-like protease SBT4.15 [Linum grandiflorum]
MTMSFGNVVAVAVALSLLFCSSSSADDGERMSYIIYMGTSPPAEQNHVLAANRHHLLLSTILRDEDLAHEVKLVSYGKIFDGFAAKLSPTEAQNLQDNPSVVSVFRDRKLKLKTTRTWDYLGMTLNVKRNIQQEGDLIVGMLDTGIYMDAPAFNDHGFGPPPKGWKGICQLGPNFTACNNKIIGARAYDNHRVGRRQPQSDPPVTPLDVVGHGTHTASTVAGVPIVGASLYGIGNGTARGGVPSARLAIYKVCAMGPFCSTSDILSGFDDAIHDGVDIISISIGEDSQDYFQDGIAIGSFHARQHGILTCAAGGNDGPSIGSVSNVAPWILTVGATGSTKQYTTRVVVGNGLKFVNYSGVSINTFNPAKKMYPLTSAKIAQNESSALRHGYCGPGSLMPDKVKGRIVLCSRQVLGDLVIKWLGGVGMIAVDDGDMGIVATQYMIPTSAVTNATANSILHYINVTKNPEAVIYKTETKSVDAPFVAMFLSRGPNIISRTILKPDLGAPGVNILASSPKIVPMTGYPEDKRHPGYDIASGTSMSTPHVAAAAVYVKSFHPTWSPEAIKSALMTTASKMKVGDPMAEYAYGAGQVNPVQAVDPGLVYDSAPEDYISFLCQEGYNASMVSKVAGHRVVCPPANPRRHDVLNYAAMNLQIHKKTAEKKKRVVANFHRTVTNVGPAGRVAYTSVATSPQGINVTVTPPVLNFRRKHQRKSFEVRVTVFTDEISDGIVLSGALQWKDDHGHNVKSPIVVSVAPQP